jgi:hypothetical protein
LDSQTNLSQPDESLAALKGIPTKDVFLEMLHKDVYQVTFNKLDGDQRVMTCTLAAHYLPEHKDGTGQIVKETNPAEAKNVTVWDLNAKGWRSFHYTRVTRILAPNSGGAQAQAPV